MSLLSPFYRRGKASSAGAALLQRDKGSNNGRGARPQFPDTSSRLPRKDHLSRACSLAPHESRAKPFPSVQFPGRYLIATGEGEKFSLKNNPVYGFIKGFGDSGACRITLSPLLVTIMSAVTSSAHTVLQSPPETVPVHICKLVN
jgi:hypothetical protein